MNESFRRHVTSTAFNLRLTARQTSGVVYLHSVDAVIRKAPWVEASRGFGMLRVLDPSVSRGLIARGLVTLDDDDNATLTTEGRLVARLLVLSGYTCQQGIPNPHPHPDDRIKLTWNDDGEIEWVLPDGDRRFEEARGLA